MVTREFGCPTLFRAYVKAHIRLHRQTYTNDHGASHFERDGAIHSQQIRTTNECVDSSNIDDQLGDRQALPVAMALSCRRFLIDIPPVQQPHETGLQDRSFLFG